MTERTHRAADFVLVSLRSAKWVTFYYRFLQQHKYFKSENKKETLVNSLSAKRTIKFNHALWRYSLCPTIIFYSDTAPTPPANQLCKFLSKMNEVSEYRNIEHSLPNPCRKLLTDIQWSPFIWYTKSNLWWIIRRDLSYDFRGVESKTVARFIFNVSRQWN